MAAYGNPNLRYAVYPLSICGSHEKLTATVVDSKSKLPIAECYTPTMALQLAHVLNSAADNGLLVTSVEVPRHVSVLAMEQHLEALKELNDRQEAQLEDWKHRAMNDNPITVLAEIMGMSAESAAQILAQEGLDLHDFAVDKAKDAAAASASEALAKVAKGMTPKAHQRGIFGLGANPFPPTPPEGKSHD